MASPTLVAIGALANVNGASGTDGAITVPVPAGVLAGDTLVTIYTVGDSGKSATLAANPPAGWSTPATSGADFIKGTTSAYSWLGYISSRTATGSEPASYSFKGGTINGGAYGTARMVAFRGGSGLLGQTAAAFYTTGTTLTLGSLTPTTATDTWLLGMWDYSSTTAPSNPSPGITSIAAGSNGSIYVSTRESYKALSSSSPTGTTTSTSSGGFNSGSDQPGFSFSIIVAGTSGATPVNLTGISLQQAANAASLSRSVLLSSTSQQQAYALGTLVSQVFLAGTSQQAASAFGTLASQVPLTGTSQQAASALGTLVSQVLLAGTSQQAASAFGVLTDTLSLTAISAQEAVAFAALSIGNPLSGVSGAQSAALASLLVAKGFSGITQAGPTASANLTVTAGVVVALTGVSFARNSAFGALTGLNALVGVSVQSQVAYGQRSVTLQGVSSAVQSAYAALSILLGTSGISSAEASARAILTVFAAGSGATLMSTATPSWVMTYDSLTQAVLQSLERSDTSTQNYVPTAITMAEFEIAQQIKTLGQLEVADTTLSPSNPILAKPARWRKTVSMTLVSNGLKQPVLLRKLEYLSAYAQSVSAPGTPLFYADYDYDHWMFAPTPDIAYAVEALVYTRLEPLSSSNQTNWLTQNAPNAMLFGALKQMMLFLKDDQRLAVFKGMFDEAMSTLKTEDTLRVGDRSAVAVDS